MSTLHRDTEQEDRGIVFTKGAPDVLLTRCSFELLVGVIMAAGTLFVLDAALPGGFVAGDGDLRYAQTMAFTTLMLFQIFNVVNARSDERSAFVQLFTNRWLWAAIGGSIGLQVLVVVLRPLP